MEEFKMFSINSVYYSEMYELLSSGTWQRSRKLNTMYQSEGEAACPVLSAVSLGVNYRNSGDKL